METLIEVSIILLPMAIFAAAIGLRIAADAQPETSWSGPRRRRLFVNSYLFLGIGLFVLLATMMVGRPLAIIPFVMFSFAAAQLIEAELKLAGSRRRGQEAELLWMLATSVRSNRNLADEVEAYARGSWGKRHVRLLELAKRLRSGLPRASWPCHKACFLAWRRSKSRRDCSRENWPKHSATRRSNTLNG